MKKLSAAVWIVLCLLPGCSSREVTAYEAQVEKGREIFFTETFDGNGRTCGTCHRAEDNYRITPAFIATLPEDDPLFVAEYNPVLKSNFENPQLMRQYGLILMNPDGRDDLENKFVMRTVQSLRALSTSVQGAEFEGYENQIDFMGPRTGWSGDGAPGDGSLRSFAIGAITQHMPKTLGREPGKDFRLPTDEELDALETFMLSIGRQEEISLPLPLKSDLAQAGQELFLDSDHKNARCSVCHINAGASSMSAVAISEGRTVNLGNITHQTGEESLPGVPNSLIPFDDGFGVPGTLEFNTPPLVEAADAGPLFHNGAVSSVEEAVALYNLDTFNESTTGKALADRFGAPTNLDANQVLAIGAFLRVLNALDNIRESRRLINDSLRFGFFERDDANRLLREAAFEIEDAIQVLQGRNLHPLAVASLGKAAELAASAADSYFSQADRSEKALEELKMAHSYLL